MGTRRTVQDRTDRRATDRAALERSTGTRAPGLSAAPADPNKARQTRKPGQRHCWVKGPDGHPIEGLMIRWVCDPAAGWQADILVIGEDSRPRPITVPAADVAPARPRSPRPA